MRGGRKAGAGEDAGEMTVPGGPMGMTKCSQVPSASGDREQSIKISDEILLSTLPLWPALCAGRNPGAAGSCEPKSYRIGPLVTIISPASSPASLRL